jgi:hypothetical protein
MIVDSIIDPKDYERGILHSKVNTLMDSIFENMKEEELKTILEPYQNGIIVSQLITCILNNCEIVVE